MGINETIVTDLNDNDLENEILGFKFLKNKCNPCLNLIDHKNCGFLFVWYFKQIISLIN